MERVFVRARGGALPCFSREAAPPYRLLVESASFLGRSGPRVELSLTCPGTGDPIRGCLAGYTPAPRAYPLPRPVLRLRGVTRERLAASFDEILRTRREPSYVRSTRCPTLGRCEVTFADPAFPREPYRVRYRITGQQVAGCWLGWRQRELDRRPYEDAPGGPLDVAGCVTW